MSETASPAGAAGADRFDVIVVGGGSAGAVIAAPLRRMGSVVDAELRVMGVTALRVADASIMPTVVSGHTNAATIMVGERAAERIAADRGLTLVETVG